MEDNTPTFYIIRKADSLNSYLTTFTTDMKTGQLNIQFGYIANCQRFSALTEAQAIAKALCSKRSGLPDASYEVLIGMLDGGTLGHTVAGAVIWSTED